MTHAPETGAIIMPGFHVAVLPLPFRRCRYVNSVRITLLTWKKSLAPLPFPPAAAPWLPFRSNRIESYFLPFCRSWTTNQRSFWSLHPCVYGKTFPAFPFSLATVINGIATERKNGNGTTTTERHNGNGETATEWCKLGITHSDRSPIPVRSAVSCTWQLQNLSTPGRRALNKSIELTSTTWLGKLFQIFTILDENAYVLISSQKLSLN